MDTGQLKVKIKELQTNLKNNKVIQELETQKFNLNDLNNALVKLLNNIEQINDEHLLNEIKIKINEEINYTNQQYFNSYSHKFINNGNFLMEIFSTEPDIKEEDNLIENEEISEEEFKERYNKLIELLNFEGEESNLILETKSKGKPFRVYKTKNNSLAFYAESSTKPMTIANQTFIDVAFERQTSNLVYVVDVLIPKIKDNTIFDFIQNNTVKKDLLEAMKNKLLNNESELIIVKDKLEGLEKENKNFEEKRQQFNEVIEKAENLDNKIKAVEDKAKLGASISYWESKQGVHRRKFYIFSGISVTLITLLIIALSFIINSHNNEERKVQTTTLGSISTKDEKNINLKKEDMKELEKSVTNDSELSSSLNFDLSKFGWYALMIFASSSIFWIIRITVKIALSNLHLSEDAFERVVMIQTYLSFIQEGEIEKHDKELILSSLFRPSNIGIIKDESSVTMSDIITAFKK